MSTLITHDLDAVFAFCADRISITRSAGMAGLGLVRDGAMVAGVVFDGWNERVVWMHVAAEPGTNWLTRSFLRAVFRYPFVQLGVQSVLGWVHANNHAARRFDEHLGFQVDAVLKGAAPNDVDVLIYRMTRDQCRFLDI